MFESLAWPLLLLIFVGGAIAVWIAGIHLSKTTDILSDRFGLGEALGGLILLAVATNLPEIAITTSASLTNNLGIAVGNILGGIAIQTTVLTFLDVFGLPEGEPLSSRTKSLVPVLEGLMVIIVLTLVVMGNQLPASLVFLHLAPGSVLIMISWLIGLWLLAKARKGLPWQLKAKGKPEGKKADKQDDKTSDQDDKKDKDQKKSITRTVIVFGIACLVTLVAGALLEQSGDAIANQFGMSGVLFGATVLAAATALPEVSTGLDSIKLGDFELAVSDIFGGNAFLPVLFLLATVLSGQASIPQAKKGDIYLTGLGILLTVAYLWGLIFRPRRRILRMGIDSLVVLILYVVGIIGLIVVGS